MPRRPMASDLFQENVQIEDLARRTWRALAFDGIDRNKQCIVRCTFAYQWGDGRIARIAAVPIGLAVDLYGLKQRRQAGGRQQHIRRELIVSEYAAAASAN